MPAGVSLSPVQALHHARFPGIASAASVLVSVPTSSTALSNPCSRLTDRHVVESHDLKGIRDEIVLANLSAARGDAAAFVGAFALDADARRIASLRCQVGVSARILQAEAAPHSGHRGLVAYMVTTTYRPGTDWTPQDWKTAIHRVRQFCNRQGAKCRYVWVAELQKRGVIHYHAVFWLPHGLRMPKWDKAGWWPHGRCQRVKVKSSAVGYLMKYLSKGTEPGQSFPKGARTYGVGGLDFAGRRARRWLRLPAFVQGNSSIFDKWTRRVGGGWLSPCGQSVPSEHICTSVGGVRYLLRVRKHTRDIDASGAFSWISDKEKALQARMREQACAFH